MAQQVVIRPPQRGARLRALWSVVAAVSLMILAGIALENEGVSKGQLARGCDTGIGIGFVLLVGAGAMAGFARIALDRRSYHRVRTDLSRWLTGALAPLLMSALTVPGAIGCAWVSRLDRLGAVGGGLLGTPGLALAGAATFALGLGMTSAVRIVEYALPQQETTDDEW